FLVVLTTTLGNDLLSDVLGDLQIAVGLHGVLATALGAGTQVGGVAKHLGQRHQSVDLLGTGTSFHAQNLATAAVQVTNDVAHVVLGHDDGNLHDGLQQAGASLAAGLLKGHGTGNLKGHFRGVHFVVGTEGQ